MRSTSRLFMAALALVSSAVFVRAQDSAAPAPPPPSAQSAPLDASGTPPSELPAIPFADGRTSAQPALKIDEAAVTVEQLVPPAPAKAEPAAAVQNPAQLPSVEVSTSFKSADTAANPPSPSTAANTAQAKGVEPLPLSARPAAVETRTGETESPVKTGTGGWIVLGLVAVALFASITRFSRRIPKLRPIKQVANLTLDPEPVPVPARLP